MVRQLLVLIPFYTVVFGIVLISNVGVSSPLAYVIGSLLIVIGILGFIPFWKPKEPLNKTK